MEAPPQSIFEQFSCPAVAVIGPAAATGEQIRMARRIGRALAEGGAHVLTGGRGGVMEAASEGAALAGGVTIGILPGATAVESPPNRFVQIPIFTGMGNGRNAVVVGSSDAVIAIGGGYGTLSEIGLALKAGKPVILLKSWAITPSLPIPTMDSLLRTAGSPGDAARLALALASSAGRETQKSPQRKARGRDGTPSGDDPLSPDSSDPADQSLEK